LSPTAALVGTPKHYAFIDCVSRATGYYDCTVFGEGGAPTETGRFRLTTRNFDPRDASEYVAFDGSHIELTGHRRLEPVEPVRYLSASPNLKFEQDAGHSLF
jgi:hypothetical protein